MKMTQMLLIVLAIVFAVALAVTVALFSLSVTGESGEVTRAPINDTTPPALLLTTPQGELTLTTPPEEVTTESNSLSYASGGDGTCTVIGLGSCSDAFVVIPSFSPAGERVVAVSARAFFGSKQINAVQIPAGVEYIGELAFANCPNLVYISVSEENEEYCDIDGILYTSDGRTLLLYPPMRAGTEITISVVTTEICEMAFYGCAYLTRVHYTGSPEAWEQIRIGAKNYSLTAAAKTFQ